MGIFGFFHGGGKRRRSTENWGDLERQLSDAQAQAKRVKGAVLNRCPQHVHGDFWVHTNEPQRCPWCEIGKLRGQLELLTMRPAPRPGGIAVKAPADGALIAAPANEPLSDPLAETQATNVAALRNAMGLATTQQLPVVSRVEPVPRITWGVKDVPAGPGSSKPTEISPATGRRATVRVSEALDEAS